MSISIIPLGGFKELGRNCVAVDVSGDIFIIDMGIHLERYIEATEEDFTKKKHTVRKLSSVGALPDIRFLRRRMKDVRGIICSHAHLDHIGAIPFLAKKFSCPIYASSFTANVIRAIASDKGVEITVLEKPCKKITSLTKTVSFEFIHVAHSTPQSALVALHTSEGIILYANDYKNDQETPFEEASDISRLKELQGNVRILIADSLYALDNSSTKSELDARNQLFNLEEELIDKRAIIASTFSSHIYRLISLCDLADKLNRKVVFIGRSLQRYIHAAKDAGIADLTQRGRLFSFAKQAKRFLETLRDPEHYFLITTGHQGEPNAILSRMVDGLFSFTQNDAIIFSCKTIPALLNIQRRAILESDLTQKGVFVIKDVHVSGHGHAQDEFELISLLKPDIFFPAHGDEEMLLKASSIAQQAGVKKEHIIIGEIGQTYTF